jgi:hypothetical protein
VIGNREEPQAKDILHRPDETEIELAGFQVSDDIAGRAAPDLQLGVRIFSGNLRPECRQNANGSRMHRAYPDLPHGLAISRAFRLCAHIYIPQDPYPPVVEGLAYNRQLNLPGCTDARCYAHPPLQRLDLHRQCWWRDMHPSRSSAEMQILYNSDEIGQLA